jgi:hypothetical protein
MGKLIIIFLGVLVNLASMACQKSTSPEGNELELDGIIEEQAAIGWEI